MCLDPLLHLSRVDPGHSIDTPPRYQGKGLENQEREGEEVRNESMKKFESHMSGVKVEIGSDDMSP